MPDKPCYSLNMHQSVWESVGWSAQESDGKGAQESVSASAGAAKWVVIF